MRAAVILKLVPINPGVVIVSQGVIHVVFCNDLVLFSLEFFYNMHVLNFG